MSDCPSPLVWSGLGLPPIILKSRSVILHKCQRTQCENKTGCSLRLSHNGTWFVCTLWEFGMFIYVAIWYIAILEYVEFGYGYVVICHKCCLTGCIIVKLGNFEISRLPLQSLNLLFSVSLTTLQYFYMHFQNTNQSIKSVIINVVQT